MEEIFRQRQQVYNEGKEGKMTKETFIKKLRSNLKNLEEKEISEIISEYSDHIEQKVASGKTVEEAIADFGDLDELAGDILSAYHIEKKQNSIEDYINGFVRFINEATARILKLSGSEFVSFLVEFVLIILMIVVLKWPVNLLVGVITGTFRVLSPLLFGPIAKLLEFLFDLIYLAVAFYVLYLFAKKRLFKGDDEKNGSV